MKSKRRAELISSCFKLLFTLHRNTSRINANLDHKNVARERQAKALKAHRQPLFKLTFLLHMSPSVRHFPAPWVPAGRGIVRNTFLTNSL